MFLHFIPMVISSFDNSTASNDIDQIVDFDTVENYTLDLRDLLSDYTFGTDNITDFVQILDNGANSDVYVDTAGTGTFTAAKGILLSLIKPLIYFWKEA